jgi:hypothetical protein
MNPFFQKKIILPDRAYCSANVKHSILEIIVCGILAGSVRIGTDISVMINYCGHLNQESEPAYGRQY